MLFLPQQLNAVTMWSFEDCWACESAISSRLHTLTAVPCCATLCHRHFHLSSRLGDNKVVRMPASACLRLQICGSTGSLTTRCTTTAIHRSATPRRPTGSSMRQISRRQRSGSPTTVRQLRVSTLRRRHSRCSTTPLFAPTWSCSLASPANLFVAEGTALHSQVHECHCTLAATIIVARRTLRAVHEYDERRRHQED